MSYESDEERLEVSPEGRADQSRLTGKAFGASVLTFVLFLGMMRLNHPLLLTRHPDQVLKQCGGAALIAFVASWAIFSIRKPGD